ncbi:MAG: dihydrodipicolinate synthase family protein [Mariniblastus sp.]|nr:dihydrodipicolinate synthase family protein [Mariniblastus sp.]
MSAILLPFTVDGQVDWESFHRHLKRTVEAGLTPAVNMDTGFSALIDERTRREVLERTSAELAGSPFVAGVFLADHPGDALNEGAYAAGMEQIQSVGGLPILFQSYGLSHQSDEQVVKNYQALARHTDQYLAFELGSMFAPFGRIYSTDVYRELLQIPQCVGAKHSSLNRQCEWDRLVMRNEHRPAFQVLTGNDLAIDMVMYGSDYLLGLSTFAPDLFARRDRMWLEGDPEFYELNDTLQYLGFFAFRQPTSAYKHSAAMFLKLRGWLPCDATHPDSPGRPESDVAVLAEIGERLGLEMKG